MVARASTLEAIYEAEYPQIESRYGAPWYLAHRVDLHNSLKELAMRDAGIGKPCQLRLRARVVSVVSPCPLAPSISTSLNLVLWHFRIPALVPLFWTPPQLTRQIL